MSKEIHEVELQYDFCSRRCKVIRLHYEIRKKTARSQENIGQQ